MNYIAEKSFNLNSKRQRKKIKALRKGYYTDKNRALNGGDSYKADPH